MRNSILSLSAAVAITCLLGGCASVIKPSGNITTQQRAVSNFTTIEASNGISVIVLMTDHEHESIEVEASENLHQYIITEREGDKLIIKLRDNVQVDADADPAVMKVFVAAKRLKEFIGSGACSFTVQNTLSQEKIKLTLYGASSFTAAVATEKLNCDLSGASTVNMSGTAEKFELGAAGASSFGNYNFTAEKARVELSGASHAELTVNRDMNVTASGASTINYRGEGVVDSQELSGASTVNRVQ